MEQNLSWEASSHSASQESPHLFLEPEGSLLCSQEPTIGPYTEPDESSLHLPTLFFWGSSSIITLHLCLPYGLFLLYSIHATWPTHLIIFDLITLIISDEEHKLQSSSFCSFLWSSTTSSLLDPDIPFSNWISITNRDKPETITTLPFNICCLPFIDMLNCLVDVCK